MDIAPLNQKTGYVRWMKSQGLPIHTGHGMADLRALEMAPYARMGGESKHSANYRKISLTALRMLRAILRKRLSLS